MSASSRPSDVSGPWPQCTVVSGGKRRIRPAIAVEQVVGGTARQVGAPDAAGEDEVAAEQVVVDGERVRAPRVAGRGDRGDRHEEVELLLAAQRRDARRRDRLARRSRPAGRDPGRPSAPRLRRRRRRGRRTWSASGSTAPKWSKWPCVTRIACGAKPSSSNALADARAPRRRGRRRDACSPRSTMKQLAPSGPRVSMKTSSGSAMVPHETGP